MTARQIYEALLIEMNKVEAPSMLLEDFNYFINKAIYQYINKQYNIYDINQQTTDNLRVLKTTANLKPLSELNNDDVDVTKRKGIVEFELPSDYLHLLNCICNFSVTQNFKCYNEGNEIQFAARRLTSDMWSQVINNFYMKPTYRRPYYFINNINTSETNPYNPYSENKFGNDGELPRTITIGGNPVSRIQREGTNRYGNPTAIRLEIRYGKDTSLFKLDSVDVDYVKVPQTIRLTQEQIDLTEDTSQMMEFPDYVCQEIINELVKLIMENASDPRLQTNIPINQSIASPVPQGKK